MTTNARDIMSTELILGHPEMTIEDAIKSLVNNRITGMPVVDKDQKIMGVVSEYDIIKTIEVEETEGALNLKKPIDFTRGAITVKEETPLHEILTFFVKHEVRRLPVIDRNEKPVGIITRRDIMRVLFYRSKTL